MGRDGNGPRQGWVELERRRPRFLLGSPVPVLGPGGRNKAKTIPAPPGPRTLAKSPQPWSSDSSQQQEEEENSVGQLEEEGETAWEMAREGRERRRTPTASRMESTMRGGCGQEQQRGAVGIRILVIKARCSRLRRILIRGSWF